MPRFISAEKKSLRSKENIFHWAISNVFQWSNLRAAFVGSLVDRDRVETTSLFSRVTTAYEASPYSEEYAEIDFVRELVEEACLRAGRQILFNIPAVEAALIERTKSEPQQQANGHGGHRAVG